MKEQAQMVKRVVAEVFGITVQDIESERKLARVAWPRQVAMYVTRIETRATLKQIGDEFNKKDHATVLHAIRQVTDRAEIYANDKHALHEVMQRLKLQRGSMHQPVEEVNIWPTNLNNKTMQSANQKVK